MKAERQISPVLSWRGLINSEAFSWTMNSLFEAYSLSRELIDSLNENEREDLGRIVKEAVFRNADDISKAGVALYLQGVDEALEGKSAKGLALMFLGASHDFFDGTRARGKGGLLSQLFNEDEEMPSFATPEGPLVDVISDRERETSACLKIAKAYLKQKGSKENYAQVINTALSCALPSAARALAESRGYYVPELKKGASPWRNLEIAKMALYLGQKKAKKTLEIAKSVYEANLNLARERLQFNEEAELDNEETKEKAKERLGVLVEFMDLFIQEKLADDEYFEAPDNWSDWINQHDGISLIRIT